MAGEETFVGHGGGGSGVHNLHSAVTKHLGKSPFTKTGQVDRMR